MIAEQKNGIWQALANVQAEITPAKKDTDNMFLKDKYADLASCWVELQKILPKHNLAVTQTGEVVDGKCWLKTTLGYCNGETISGLTPILHEVSKGLNVMQSFGSAWTYARRYGLAAICGLTSEDDDAGTAGKKHGVDTHTGPVSKPEERPAPATAKVNPNTEVNTSDVVGKQGTIIMEEMPEVKQKDGTNKNGKPYTRFYFKNQADGIYYSTFDRNLSDEMKTLQGQRVEASFKEGINLTSRDVVGICIIRESSPETEVFNDKNAVGDDQLPF